MFSLPLIALLSVFVIDNRFYNLVSGTDDNVFILVYVDALVHGFRPLLSCFLYDVVKNLNVVAMQLQSSC